MSELTRAAPKTVRNISNAVSNMKETAGDVGRHTADKIDAIRETGRNDGSKPLQ